LQYIISSLAFAKRGRIGVILGIFLEAHVHEALPEMPEAILARADVFVDWLVEAKAEGDRADWWKGGGQ
jgi:hypothetical protein